MELIICAAIGAIALFISTIVNTIMETILLIFFEHDTAIKIITGVFSVSMWFCLGFTIKTLIL
jgi:hypothetical protein